MKRIIRWVLNKYLIPNIEVEWGIRPFDYSPYAKIYVFGKCVSHVKKNFTDGKVVIESVDNG